MFGAIGRQIDPRRSVRARLSLACGIATLVPTLLASVLIGATIRTFVEPELALRLIAEVERLLVGLGLALGGAFALLGWALADRLTSRLRRLSDTIEDVRHDGRAVDVPSAVDRDEVGALGRGLGDLLRSVECRERELRGVNETLERCLRERTAELRTASLIAERIDHAVIVTDAHGRVDWVNDAFTRMTGYPADEVVGRRRDDVLHGPDTDPDGAAHVAACIERGDGFALDVLNYARDGRPFWAAVDARPVRDDAGALTNFVAIERDVTAPRERQDRLRRAALHDALTGLPNPVLFHDRLAHAARRATREPADRFAVLFVDLAGPESISERLGRAVGDHLLIAATQLLEGNVRPGDSVARLGDDEFGVLLEHVASVDVATRVAERILERLGQPIELDGHAVRVSASIGIALSGTGSMPFEDTLRGADAARWRAKLQGNVGYAVFDMLTDGAALAHGSRRSWSGRPSRLAS